MTLRNLCGGLAALALIAGPALAQRTPLFQSGQAAPNDLLKSDTQGLAGKSGGIDGDVLGNGVNPFTADDRGGKGICTKDNNGLAATGYNRLCIGHDADHNGIISLESTSPLGDKGLYVDLNGTRYPFPGAGNGDLIGPDGADADHLPVFNGSSGKALKNSAYAATAIGRYGFAQYGVSPSNSAALNATYAQAAIDAAHTAGLGVVCDVQGDININGMTVYGGDTIEWINGCQLHAAEVGKPLFQVVDAPGHTYAQALTYRTRFVHPQIDMGGIASPAIFLESSLAARVENPAIVNVGSGTWMHNDSFVDGSYPVAGVVIKGNQLVGGSYYNVVDGGYIFPATDDQGIGVWLGGSVNHTGQRSNFNVVDGTLFQKPDGGAGTPIGFETAIKISAGGDNRIIHANVSSAVNGIYLGGDDHPVQRTVIEQVYAERNTCGVNDDSTGSDASGTSITWASTGNTTTPYCRGSGSTAPIKWSLGQSLQLDYYADPAGGDAPNPISNLNYFQLVPPHLTVGRIELDSFDTTSEFTTYRRNGDSSAYSAMLNGDVLGRYYFSGHDGAIRYAGAHMEGVASEDWATSVSDATIYPVAAGGNEIGGQGGTPGACTVTVTGGTYTTPAQLSGTVDADGHLTDPLTVAVAGEYTVSPGTSGVFVTGCGLTGARVNLGYATVRGGTRLDLFRTPNGSTTQKVFLRSTTDGGVATCDSAGACATGLPGDGGLSVKGSLRAADGGVVMDSAGHPGAGRGTPTVSSCGTGAAIFGKDAAFYVTVGSGTVTSCLVTFGLAWSTAPIVAATMRANNSVWTNPITTTAVTLNFPSNAAGQIVNVLSRLPQ